MKSIRVFIFCICAGFAAPAFAQERGWRGIVPLHSTRQDVERLIGPPVQTGGITYDLKDERVNIGYAASACAKGWPYGWNVPPGVVTNIQISPKGQLKLSDLKLDLSKFKKFTNPHLGGRIHYNNLEEGLSIGTLDRDDGHGEVVLAFEYFPSARDRHLMCPEAAAREREIETGQSAPLPSFFYYFDVSPNEERVRLAFFVDQLKNYSARSKIYVIGYAGRKTCPNEAFLRANGAKKLLERLGVRASRIITMDGGHSDSVWIQLYVVPPGKPKPLSNPNIHPNDVRLPANCSHIRPRGFRFLQPSHGVTIV